MWGPEAPVRAIMINDRHMQIRQNLHHFLQSTHELQEKHWFWIDQICIDQQNIPERNTVVRGMADIYRSAEGVRIWLGEGNELSDYAFDILRQYEEVVTQDFDTDVYEAEASSIFECKEKAEAMCELFSRPYWGRQWIFQEVWHAKVTRLQCGIATVDVDTSNDDDPPGLPGASVADLFDKYSDYWSVDKSSISVLFSKGWNGDQDGLIDPKFLLSKFLGDCENPRDKIFSIQGVIPVAQRTPVDYDKSVSDVFWTALRKVFGFPSWQFDYAESMDALILSMRRLAEGMGISSHEASVEEIGHFARRILDERGKEWPRARALTVEPTSA